MEWGREIEVNGVRPDWLRGRVVCDLRTRAGWCNSDETVPALSIAEKWAWSHQSGEPNILAIRLPADSIAYRALDAGFTPWFGGDEAPADWDGGDVLWENGGQSQAGDWQHSTNYTRFQCRIIGYRKKAAPQPATADTVTVQRLTISDVAEARQAYFDQCDRASSDDSATFYAKHWGLIREETVIERFAREAGVTINDDNRDAVTAALAFGR